MSKSETDDELRLRLGKCVIKLYAGNPGVSQYWVGQFAGSKGSLLDLHAQAFGLIRKSTYKPDPVWNEFDWVQACCRCDDAIKAFQGEP